LIADCGLWIADYHLNPLKLSIDQLSALFSAIRNPQSTKPMSYAHKNIGDSKVRLRAIDPDENGGLERAEGELRLKKLSEELTELQELLYAAGDQSVLVILQGLDTSGKDGTIKSVMGPLNALGCRVASFKVPTENERSHDFLWRVHRETPGLGEITIFNRSHYEDVLVVRVHNLVPEKVWRARYEHINAFEKLLTDSKTIVLKFFLHISRKEQEERLIEREQDATKYWKLSVGDWKERERWIDYQRAYEDAINHCSAPHAPWYIIPANRKWHRNLAVADAIVQTLKPYKKAWMKKLEAAGRIEKAQIEEYRISGGKA
jgi:PPK2 family polyphosphate:nucleotide phosphotransferase